MGGEWGEDVGWGGGVGLNVGLGSHLAIEPGVALCVVWEVGAFGEVVEFVAAAAEHEWEEDEGGIAELFRGVFEEGVLIHEGGGRLVGEVGCFGLCVDRVGEVVGGLSACGVAAGAVADDEDVRRRGGVGRLGWWVECGEGFCDLGCEEIEEVWIDAEWGRDGDGVGDVVALGGADDGGDEAGAGEVSVGEHEGDDEHGAGCDVWIPSCVPVVEEIGEGGGAEVEGGGDVVLVVGGVVEVIADACDVCVCFGAIACAVSGENDCVLDWVWRVGQD